MIYLLNIKRDNLVGYSMILKNDMGKFYINL